MGEYACASLVVGTGPEGFSEGESRIGGDVNVGYLTDVS